MSILLEVGRVAIVVNLALLLALGAVWVQSYRRTRARYPLALSVFAGLLFAQNVVWLYLYLGHDGYIYWFTGASTPLQAAMTSLCGLETAALVVLGWLTLR